MEHGAHHAHDHHTDPQDMRNMGGLRHKMKTSFWAYLFGTLALVGVFPFAGFWSKDEILAEAYLHGFGEHGVPLAAVVYLAGAIGAIFTAFYMGRQIGLVFGGQPRTELSKHAVEPGWRMTGPLVVLAFFALTLGFINIPADFPLIGHGWFHGFAGEVHLLAEEAAPGISFAAVPFNWFVAITSSLLGILSFAFGWWLYARVSDAKAKDPIQTIPWWASPSLPSCITNITSMRFTGACSSTPLCGWLPSPANLIMTGLSTPPSIWWAGPPASSAISWPCSMPWPWTRGWSTACPPG
jgi:NADH-quinone oxidoreductase subunit L